MGYQLGIDLGTTYTAAAVCRSSDHGWVDPEVVTLGTRNATVASVLFIGPDGGVVVGEAAERRAITDPDRVVREFKRRIGDPTPVVVAGRAWAPEELSARLVRWVVDRVAEREGGPAEQIAVTHPAAWGQHKKELLAGALAGQGLAVTFLAEPQAAALHYAEAERVGPGSTIAVYDLGGGTFDAAVVRKADPAATAAGLVGFGLLGRPEGLERLGGIDFDQAVFEHVVEGLPGAFTDLDESDPEVLSAVARIRRDCTDAKEALSSDTDVSIPVMLPGSRGSVRLHRSEFESLIRPYVEDTVEALRKAVGSAGLAPAQLTAVLLVGGSSRIPLVGQLVSEQLGRPVAVDADPKNAIAKGAALAISPKPVEVAAPAPSRRAAAPAGAAGAAAGAAAMAAGNMAPPRPPRPSLPNTPPPGVDRTGAHQRQAGPPPGAHQAGPYPTGAHQQEQQFTGSHRSPGGHSHESANSLYTGSTERPPERRSRHAAAPPPPPEPDDDWEYDAEPEQRKRPVGMLIGVGGLLAVAAIVIAVVLSQNSGNPSTTPAGSSTESTSKQQDPGPAPTPHQGTNGGGKTATRGPDAGPVEPPPPSADTKPTTTTPTTAPTTTAKPTTQDSEPTAPADESAGAAGPPPAGPPTGGTGNLPSAAPPAVTGPTPASDGVAPAAANQPVSTVSAPASAETVSA
ncbi:Hsp70 family protein [Pseudonocardia sp. TRM90224]|uniref:Hsp70 family protein n=1 Tax=Pseudonocardia sp. TRM90224 TaxID=2812678 RepID=UPI001E2D9E09|nr:Hsp70 family protein [Pseudonocardia sp. TRM90224]